ncbi:MAG TPA: hypothetical protein VI282_02680, partial [Verrucomicrobiae bacterium]
MLAGLSVQAQRPYRGTFQSVRRVVLRLENRANMFRNSFEDWHSEATNTAGSSENMNVTVRDFNDSVRRLRDRFDRRQATSFEVQDVLSRATAIDDFVRRNPMDARTQNFWASIRSDLNQLASAYNLSWQTSSYYPPTNNPPFGYQALIGTYRLDPARSEDARAAAERAARNLSYSERNRILELVSRRLNSPDELAIDVHGRTVTMASTRAAQVSFDADGRDRVETSPNGRTVHSRAWLSGNQLTINSTGDRGNQ